MATNRGKFSFILGIDCETTGLCFDNDSPIYNEKTGEYHQAISWGVLVIDATTLEVVEECYVEIAWNDMSKTQREEDPKFGTFAEKVHGLTFEHLEENGMDEEEAVAEIVSMILKYWGPTTGIVTLGHNVHTFDMPFLRDMCRRHGIELKFNNRHVDTNSIGFANWETYNSDDLFEMLGFEDRKEHNALDDIKQTLEAVKVSRIVFQAAIAG
jgi:DNA polymerase III epsilon subunit-like protein